MASTNLKVHFMCSHVFRMALERDTDIEIEAPQVLVADEPLSVAVCEDCENIPAHDFMGRKCIVTVVRPKRKRSEPSAPAT
jgi:hypothetical protein